MRRLKTVFQRGLRDSLETSFSELDSPFFDVRDSDVLAYVHDFVRSSTVRRNFRIGKLETAQDALNALELVERLRPFSENHNKTIRALRELLTSQDCLEQAN
ncbi:MAG: hypothetical protein K1X79_09975 [Oligoflexia bacterium]|nr:hypothetical protein [Oligoflexia bacterium]